MKLSIKESSYNDANGILKTDDYNVHVHVRYYTYAN